MPEDQLLIPPLPPAPWRVTTERRGDERTHIHTLSYTRGKHTTAVDSRTGPHGQKLLLDICEHLNTTGGQPSIPAPVKPASQPNLL